MEGLTDVIDRAIVRAGAGMIVGDAEPDDGSERSKREQSDIDIFADRAGDHVAQSRSRNQQMNAEKNASCTNQTDHAVLLHAHHMRRAVRGQRVMASSRVFGRAALPLGKA